VRSAGVVCGSKMAGRGVKFMVSCPARERMNKEIKFLIKKTAPKLIIECRFFFNPLTI